MSHTFRSTAKHSVTVPLTVTKAVNVITAICHRNSTAKIIGERGFLDPSKQISEATYQKLNNEYMGYAIPVQSEVMSEILGAQLGNNFQNAMLDHALREYFAQVSDKLYQFDITLSFSRTHWFIVKLPAQAMKIVNEHYAYTLVDLAQQAPDGFTGSELKPY